MKLQLQKKTYCCKILSNGARYVTLYLAHLFLIEHFPVIELLYRDFELITIYKVAVQSYEVTLQNINE